MTPSRPPDDATARFLPVDREGMAARGWAELDILLVSGDAYVDHPAFGAALLGRRLEAAGYRVGIVPQPSWEGPEAIARLGRPRLFCGVTAGALDSMVAHYTAFRKKRSDDAYTPGGRAGARPNRACLVYTGLVRQAFPGLPVLLGGIEASLRRFAHYDWWSGKIRNSILLDSKADLLLYGMAERGVLEAARRLAAGEPLAGIAGSVWAERQPPSEVRGGWLAPEGPRAARWPARPLPPCAAVREEPPRLLEAALAVERQVHRADHALVQEHRGRCVVAAPPPPPLTGGELDALYELPFTREAHPQYREGVPALETVKFSVAAVRGCGGGCSFCALAAHQGRRPRSRSRESVLREVRRFAELPDWRGSVSDVGGPTANAWASRCAADPAACRRPSCYAPAPCPHLELAQQAYLELLRAVRALPGVRHVRIGSGLRHDLALAEPEAAAGLVAEFVGGQLKLAPEHAVGSVLARMRKTDFALFERFRELFARVNQETGREQYIVPYVMSAFPGCTTADMRALAAWFRRQGWRPRQAQCFLPTPGTVATAMHWAGVDESGTAIHVARSDAERREQHNLLLGRG